MIKTNADEMREWRKKKRIGSGKQKKEGICQAKNWIN